jgi:hypothetical protein
MHSIEHMAELRQSIAAGSYQPDSRKVACSIVRWLADVRLARAVLSESGSPLDEVLEPGRPSQASVRSA